MALASLHGIISSMKLIVAAARLTQPLPRVVLTPLFLVIAASIACVPNKTALSSSANSNTPINQPSEQPANSTEQSSSNCSLTMAAAPVLNGLKLGMTPDEVLTLFPGSKDDADLRASVSRPPSEFGVSSFVIRPAQYQSKEKYAGINQITFTLLDGRISGFSIGYNGPAYSHVDEFVAKVVEGTSFPPTDQWQAYVGMDTQLKTLQCKDFEARVFTGGEGGKLNYVLMRDLEADKKLKDRRKKASEKASPSP